MATETVELASDHASTTHEQFVKQEKDEAIAEKINSLANDDGDKHDDKADNTQGQATPSSKTEDEVKAELAAGEIEKSDDSAALKVSVDNIVKQEKDEAIAEKINSLANEDGDKHDDKPDDAQDQATPSPTTEGDEIKAELAAGEIERSDDSSALNVSVEDIVNPEKDEAIAEKINSLANEDGDKHDDKPDDAQDQATPSSTTEGDEIKAELAAGEIERSDDSSALNVSVEDTVNPEKDEAIAEKINSLANEDGDKHVDKPDNTQGQATPSKTEGDEVKAELAAIERSDDSSALKVSVEDIVNPEKDEAIADRINSLANEDGDKHDDKPDDAQGQATPSSTTEGDEIKAALAVAEIEKSDDSSALNVSVEDSLKPDIVDDAQNPAVEKEDETKAESVVVEKTDDSVPLEVVADNLKEEKDLIPESRTISVAELVHDTAISQQDESPTTEPAVKETSQQIEEEPLETNEEKQSKTEDIREAEIVEKAVDTTEKSSDAAETNQSKEEVKQAEILETSVEKEEKPEPLATEETQVTEEPEKEAQEKSAEAEKPNTIATVEPSAEANEENAAAAISEATNNIEVEPTEKGKAESLVTEVEPTETVKEEPVVTEIEPRETVKEEHVVTKVEPTETVKEEPAATEVDPTETVKEEPAATEIEATETVNEVPVVTEVDPTETVKEEPAATEVEEATETVKEEPVVTEVEPTETVKGEPVVTKVEENQKEPEQHSTEQREEEKPNTSSIPEQSTETNDVIAVEEKSRELEFEAAIPKETKNDEAGPAETEKAESVVTEVDENQGEPEIQSFKQEEEVKPKEETESQEQTGDTVEVHPPKDSDIEVVKETNNSESVAIPVKENIDPLSNGVEEKLSEQLKVGEEVGETIKEVEPEQATEKSEGPLNGTIKEEESETNTTINTAQVSLNGEVQTNPANLVEPSPEVEEKVVVEDGKKEVVGVKENPTSVKEKVVVAAEDEKMEPEASDVDAVQVSSRDAEVDIKKTEEQSEAKTATREADTKEEEISKAVNEPVRETLASKLSKFEKDEEETIQTGADNLEKEKIEEPVKTEVEATKENDTTISKDLPKETPAKPAQKQSNNLIAKVKQSLVKAKKAITGKSPSSKNLSSEPKGDIKVK